MKLITRIISIVCAILILLTMVVGCQKSDNSKTDNSTDTTKKSDTAKDETKDKDAPKKDVKLRFSWWGGDVRHEGTLNAIDLYMQKNPNVKIEAEYSGWKGYYEKLVTQLAGGAAPDLIQISSAWFYDFSKQGELFVDLYKSDIIDLSIFDQNFLKSMCEYDGILQGVPTGIMADTMVYNKEFFEKNSISLDTEWTWEKLIEVGTRVHKDNSDYYLMHTSPQLIRYYLRQKAGTALVNEKDFTPSFTEEMAVEAFKVLKEMYSSGTKLPAEDKLTVQQSDEHVKWQKGETGLFVAATSMLAKIKSNSPFEIGVARYPVIPGSKNTGIEVIPSQLFSVNVKSENKEECEKLLNWMYTDKDAVLALGDIRGVPPTESGRKILDEAGKIDPLVTKATEIAVAAAGEKVNAISNNQELYKILVDVCERVAFGKATPEEAGKELLDSYKEKLEELKAQ